MPRHFAIARALGPIAAQLATWRQGSSAELRVHVACSGGADSVALFGLLHCLQRRFHLRLSIGHVQHGLRAEAAVEAAGVHQLAVDHGALCLQTDLELSRGPGLAARARHARYAALREQAASVGATWIALGHSATDQAETLLMHLTRGAGLDGLAAMSAIENGLWRPCLHLDRPTLRELAQRMKLTFFDDPTNLDLRHLRVRMREVVLPELVRQNPHAVQAIAAAAAHARAAEDALTTWAQLEGAKRTDAAGQGVLAGFHELPQAVQLRVVRGWAAQGGVDLTEVRTSVIADIAKAAVSWAQHLAGAGQALSPPRPRHWDLRPNRVLCVDRRGLTVRAASSDPACP